MDSSGVYKQGKVGTYHSQLKRSKKKKEIMIWDEVMWYTYVDLDPSEIKMVGQVEEEEPTPKRFKSTRV
jgi:hypothetical protein